MGEAMSAIPEPYSELPWSEISLCEYREETLILCHPDYPPIVYGTSIGWKDVKLENIDPLIVKFKEDRLAK
jgi:hypothetical protein